MVRTSSKALLLVEDADVGRRIVAAVTRTALEKAPGLDIWGHVETDEASRQGEPFDRLDALHAAHGRTRWSRPSPKLRFPTHPFSDQCSQTGLPATKRRARTLDTGVEVHESVSAVADAVLDAAQPAHRWLREFPQRPAPISRTPTRTSTSRVSG